MVKLRVKVDEVGCRKPGCKRRLTIPQRHHRRHQLAFVLAFQRVGMSGKRFKEFCDRYHSFHPDDLVDLCEWHHAEIHAIYDEIIDRDIQHRRKTLGSYSWKQAESLMKKLEKACLDWEKKKTPGINPKSRARWNPETRKALDAKKDGFFI